VVVSTADNLKVVPTKARASSNSRSFRSTKLIGFRRGGLEELAFQDHVKTLKLKTPRVCATRGAPGTQKLIQRIRQRLREIPLPQWRDRNGDQIQRRIQKIRARAQRSRMKRSGAPLHRRNTCAKIRGSGDITNEKVSSNSCAGFVWLAACRERDWWVSRDGDLRWQSDFTDFLSGSAADRTVGGPLGDDDRPDARDGVRGKAGRGLPQGTVLPSSEKSQIRIPCQLQARARSMVQLERVRANVASTGHFRQNSGYLVFRAAAGSSE
jgi:hypothetical protein